MKVIGFVHSGSNTSFIRQFAAIDTGLAVLGFKKDADYKILPQWADDQPKLLREHVKGLVENEDVDVIITAGGPMPAIVAKEEAAKLVVKKPVVFTTVADPVGNGLVGANLTGMAGKTSELDGDRLALLAELLKEQKSGARKKLKVLFKKGRPNLGPHKNHLKNVASDLGLDFSDDEVEDDQGLDNAFATGLQGAEAMLVTADAFFNNRREALVKKTAERKVPAIYQWREFVEVGGLMSYGPDILEAYVFAGAYAARILKGEKPADMPISEPTNFELVINRTTAAALGITISDSLKKRAELID